MNTMVNDIITWAVTAGVGSLSAYATHKGLLGKVGQFIAEHAKPIEQGVVHVAEAIVDTPAAKAAELHLKAELDKALGDFKQSRLGELAAQALQGAKLAELSKEEVDAIALHISTLLPQEWKVTKAEIVAALDLAQKGADAFAQAPVVQAAAKFAAEVKAAQPQA